MKAGGSLKMRKFDECTDAISVFLYVEGFIKNKGGEKCYCFLWGQTLMASETRNGVF